MFVDSMGPCSHGTDGTHSGVAKEVYVIYGTICGKHARQMFNKNPQERQRLVLAQLARVFESPEMKTKCLKYIDKDWMADAYTGGGYTGVLGPNILTTIGKHLYTNVGNVLHFAAAEVATDWNGKVKIIYE